MANGLRCQLVFGDRAITLTPNMQWPNKFRQEQSPRLPDVSFEHISDCHHVTHLPDFSNEEGGPHDQGKEHQSGSPDVSQHEWH